MPPEDAVRLDKPARVGRRASATRPRAGAARPRGSCDGRPRSARRHGARHRDRRPTGAARDSNGANASPTSLAALAFTAAAFTAVLFLLVIELVAGFAMSPLRAALGVTVLPLAALAAAAIPGPARARALAGAVLLAGGAAALAFLPAPSDRVDDRAAAARRRRHGPRAARLRGRAAARETVGEAAVGLVARHVGIVVVLAILAPVATAQLESATDQAILQGAALVLDAQIDPLQKLELAPALLEDVDIDSPRAALTDAVDGRRAEFADDAAVYDRLAKRLDDVVVVAVQDAFRIVYLIAAALALLAAALLISAWRRPAVLAATAIALGDRGRLRRSSAATRRRRRWRSPNPCDERALPDTGGLTGAIQNEALRVLDRAACRFGSSREEFALALFDRERAAEYEREHGVDPRNLGGLLSLLGG